MVNWKTFKINEIRITENYVRFYFEGRKDGVIIIACGSHGSFIICKNRYPFNTYQTGDSLEIDIDGIRWYDYEKDNIDTTSIIRKVNSSSSTNLIATRGSSSDIVISSSSLANAMGSSETMELARHMSRMVDENDKEYELKIEDNTNTRFTYSLICRKQK